MSNKTGFQKSCLIAAFFVVAAAAVIVVLFLRSVQRTRTAASIPPSVLVNSPAAGESAPAGSFLSASVTVAAQNPISRLELWLDGALVDTQTPDPSLGEVTTFYAVLQLRITEGPHIFSARAVDAKGLVGQSLPVAILGSPRAGQNDGNPSQPQPPSGNTPSQPSSPGQPPSGNAPPQPPVAIIPPAPLPVPPPGAMKLSVTAYQPIDIGSLLPIILSGRPKAPTSLQAGFENCTVRLVWVDNATNEKYFNVWMQAFGGPSKVIATLKGTSQTGPAWYEFASPQMGIYSFWIEAVNALGGQSSEIAWVGVTDLSCGPGVATHLNVEIADMFVSGGHDRAYCYLSVEGAPEKRIPLDDSQFVQVLGGWGDVSNWTGSGSSFLLPEPQDGEVALEGTCLGWQGGSGPNNLGAFKVSAPKEIWDGRRLELKGAGYIIGYRIRPYGATQASGFFTYTDFTIPSPSQPWITTGKSSNASENEKLARRPTLHWGWTGDPSKLTSFTILLDGKFFRSVPNWQGGASGQWEQMFLLPTSCGGTYKFQVVANSGEAQSVPSMIYEHKQPLCEIYAEVKFETITFTDVDDGEPGSCDTVEAYYRIGVNGKGRQFGEFEGDDIKMDCGEFYFSRLPALTPQEHKYESVDTFIVPISAQNPSGNAINIWASFTDNDPSLFDDADSLCYASVNLNKSSQAWVSLNNPKTIQLPCLISDDYDARGFVTVSVRGFIAPSGSP